MFRLRNKEAEIEHGTELWETIDEAEAMKAEWAPAPAMAKWAPAPAMKNTDETPAMKAIGERATKPMKAQK